MLMCISLVSVVASNTQGVVYGSVLGVGLLYTIPCMV